ncbi:transposase [Laribacter hongkongensis]|uniref:transposase n=1 Tax=Laribacter hongkongensis TaxID=168471 RepID=UPI00358DADA6
MASARPVCSLLKLPWLEWPVPCFSTVSRRQATLTVTIPVPRRTEPLHLLVDSTGLKICGEGDWGNPPVFNGSEK